MLYIHLFVDFHRFKSYPAYRTRFSPTNSNKQDCEQKQERSRPIPRPGFIGLTFPNCNQIRAISLYVGSARHHTHTKKSLTKTTHPARRPIPFGRCVPAYTHQKAKSNCSRAAGAALCANPPGAPFSDRASARAERRACVRACRRRPTVGTHRLAR